MEVHMTRIFILTTAAIFGVILYIVIWPRLVAPAGWQPLDLAVTTVVCLLFMLAMWTGRRRRG